MKKLLIVLIGMVFFVLLALGIYVMSTYNTFVKADEDVTNKQAQVEVQLQRRFDLIPNLVESVKGVMTQEQTIFLEIANARTKYGNAAAGSTEKIEAANELESSLGRLLVIVENYPDLKSNTVVTGLMDELAGTENRIAVERQRYNDAVTSFNKMIKTFPNNVVANMFGFEKKVLFESADGAETVPSVDLSL